MIKFAIQQFLNPALSWDSGALKFVVTKKDGQHPDITFQIRDCTSQISLEFDPNLENLKWCETRDELRREHTKNKRLLKQRRAKIANLMAAMDQFAVAYQQALDEVEAEEMHRFKTWKPKATVAAKKGAV